MSNTIAQNLTRLSNARDSIASAITAKGGTVASGAGFEDFSTAITSIPSTISPDPLPVMTDVGILLYSNDFKINTEAWYDAVTNTSYSKGTKYKCVYSENSGIYADTPILLPSTIFTTGFTLYNVGVFTSNPSYDYWTALSAIFSTTDGTSYTEEGSVYVRYNGFRANGDYNGGTHGDYAIASGGSNVKGCFAIRFNPTGNVVEVISADGTVAGSFNVGSQTAGKSYYLYLTSNINSSLSSPNVYLLGVAMAYSSHSDADVLRNLNFLKQKFGIS